MPDGVTVSRDDLRAIISEIVEDKVAGLKKNRDDILTELREERSSRRGLEAESVSMAELRAENAQLRGQLDRATTTLNSGSVDRELRDAIAASDIDPKYAEAALDVLRRHMAVEPKTGKVHGWTEDGKVATFPDAFRSLLDDPRVAPMRTSVEVVTKKDPFGRVSNEVMEKNPFLIGGDAGKATAMFKADRDAAKALMAKASDKLAPYWRPWLAKNG